MESIIETGRRIAESFNLKGEGFDNSGKKNAYECPACHAYIVTIDRHPGVTPFMTKCGECGDLAQSKMYRVAEHLYPTHEWYRPERLEDVPPGSEYHISRGGLVLRPIGAEGWQAGWPAKTKLDPRRELESLKAKMDDEQNFLRSQIPRVYSDKETLTRQQIRHAERKNRGAPAEITMYGHRYQRID